MTGCKISSSVFLSVTKPAMLDLQNIKKIAIIDRAERRSSLLGLLEGYSTGEKLFQDDFCKEKLMQGIISELQNSGRFEIIETNIHMKRGNGFLSPGKLLTQNKVDSMRDIYKADAVLAIEFFDSDLKKNTYTKLVNDNYICYAFQTLSLYADLRLYDSNHVADEAHIEETKIDSITGNSEKMVLKSLPNSHRENALNMSYSIGKKYGRRLVPHDSVIVRKIYVKGSDELIKAYTFVKKNNWKSAIDIWKTLESSSNKTIAKRASYNLIVGQEFMGKLTEAISQAKKNFAIYKSLKTKLYITHLTNRILENEKVQNQMK